MTVLATWKDRMPWPSSVVRALALSIFRSDGTAIELSVRSRSEETQIDLVRSEHTDCLEGRKEHAAGGRIGTIGRAGGQDGDCFRAK